jgi:hypothetical protein
MSKCRSCEQDLVIELDPDSFDEATASASVGSSVTAPDDLLLPCACHFHWSVLWISLPLPFLKDFDLVVFFSSWKESAKTDNWQEFISTWRSKGC